MRTSVLMATFAVMLMAVTAQAVPNAVFLYSDAVDVFKLNGGTGGDPGGGDGAAPSRFFGTDGTNGIRAQINNAIANNSPSLNQNTHPDTLIFQGQTPNPAQSDNYRLKTSGTFRVNNQNGIVGETIDLTFTLRTDDGSQFRIFGEDFTSVAGDGRTFLENIDGDQALTADFFTGNTNALGHIQLTEGTTYQWEGYMYEGGGGSRFELQAALGTHNGFNGNDFFVLNTEQVVPEPATAVLGLMGLAGLVARRRRAA